MVPKVCFSQVSLGLTARTHAVATNVHCSMYVFQYTGLRCTLSWDGVAAEHYSVADAYQPPAMEHAEVTCVFFFFFFFFQDFSK